MDEDNRRKEIFEKYANKYNTDKGETKKNIDSVDLQKNIFNKMYDRGLSNTAIEKLLDMTIDDIQHQYAMKQDMENKAGFMIAFLGVLLGVILQKELYMIPLKNIIENNNSIIYNVMNGLVFLSLTVSGISSIVFMVATLLIGDYRKYRFEDKKLNFDSAVDDQIMFFTRMLDSNTNVWIKNEAANERKYKNLKILVSSIVLLLVSAIICCCIG